MNSAIAAPPPFPAPTDLSGVTQNWDKNLPSASRFTVLANFGGAAVRDNNTGLEWEQSPTITTMDWLNARFECANRTIGNLKGWRLPSIPELASLVDPSVAFGEVHLPPGHPFTNVQTNNYWSATSFADNAAQAWGVLFSSGIVFSGAKFGP
ncbi:MAG TPA: DUF1566 domain-containing protein, partial [Nitrospiraceae bacterium]|nr:DUF1566 domain-containing protein [Nitrospiraceae bacterium]